MMGDGADVVNTHSSLQREKTACDGLLCPPLSSDGSLSLSFVFTQTLTCRHVQAHRAGCMSRRRDDARRGSRFAKFD